MNSSDDPIQLPTAGFPPPDWAPAATGIFRVAVLFIDFNDAPARYDTRTDGAAQLLLAERYLEAASYGKLNVRFVPLYRWLRVNGSWHDYSYTPGDVEGISSSDVAPTAIALSEQFFDYSAGIDAVMMVHPSYYFSGGNATSGVRLTTANGVRVRQVSSINAFPNDNPNGDLDRDPNGSPNREPDGDPLSWWYTAAHELGHNFGLDDLYPYDNALASPPLSTPPGQAWVTINAGLMGLTAHLLVDQTDARYHTNTELPQSWEFNTGSTINTHLEMREMLAWSRWQLGWLSDDKVACITRDGVNTDIVLTPIAAPTGVAMLVIGFGDNDVAETVVVLETRRRLGYDRDSELRWPCCDGQVASTKSQNLIEEGVLIYAVDASEHPGNSPITFEAENLVFPDPLDHFPTFGVGDGIIWDLVDGTKFSVDVVSDDGTSYVIRITHV